jgi:hypothetical protein
MVTLAKCALPEIDARAFLQDRGLWNAPNSLFGLGHGTIGAWLQVGRTIARVVAPRMTVFGVRVTPVSAVRRLQVQVWHHPVRLAA